MRSHRFSNWMFHFLG